MFFFRGTVLCFGCFTAATAAVVVCSGATSIREFGLITAKFLYKHDLLTYDPIEVAEDLERNKNMSTNDFSSIFTQFLREEDPEIAREQDAEAAAAKENGEEGDSDSDSEEEIGSGAAKAK